MQINLANLKRFHGLENDMQYQAQLDAEKLKDLESKMKTIKRINIAILERITQNEEVSNRMVENMAQTQEMLSQKQKTISQKHDLSN